MKITGWEKLNGITYKGYSILNPIHNAMDTRYVADVMDLATKQRLSLDLETRDGIRALGNRTLYTIKLEDKRNRIIVQRVLDFEMLKSMATFRQIYEMCIEDYLKEVEESWTKQSGIVNVVQNNGTTESWQSKLPTFDDFAKMWKNTPMGQVTNKIFN